MAPASRQLAHRLLKPYGAGSKTSHRGNIPTAKQNVVAVISQSLFHTQKSGVGLRLVLEAIPANAGISHPESIRNRKPQVRWACETSWNAEPLRERTISPLRDTARYCFG
jgi:hypothetical protein